MRCGKITYRSRYWQAIFALITLDCTDWRHMSSVEVRRSEDIKLPPAHPPATHRTAFTFTSCSAFSPLLIWVYFNKKKEKMSLDLVNRKQHSPIALTQKETKHLHVVSIRQNGQERYCICFQGLTSSLHWWYSIYWRWMFSRLVSPKHHIHHKQVHASAWNEKSPLGSCRNSLVWLECW